MSKNLSVTSKPKKAFIQTNTLFNYFDSKDKPVEKEQPKPPVNTITNYFPKPVSQDFSKTQPLPIKKEQKPLTENFKIKKEQSQTNLSNLVKTDTPKPGLKRKLSSTDLPPANTRKCPFYKRVENTQICVDAFSYGDIENCNAYFLSHYHYDHFIGLKKDFSNQMLCSRVTANLVIKHIKVDKKFIKVLEFDKFQNVYDGDSSIQVALIDANQ